MEVLRCRHCGDVVGSYEPLVVLLDGRARVTSKAAEPDIKAKPGEHYHRACYILRHGEDSIID